MHKRILDHGHAERAFSNNFQMHGMVLPFVSNIIHIKYMYMYVV